MRAFLNYFTLNVTIIFLNDTEFDSLKSSCSGLVSIPDFHDDYSSFDYFDMNPIIFMFLLIPFAKVQYRGSLNS